ncbi:MAG: hypothetical protein FWG65_03510 [Turicibacter sp.]|nr:hypothetical protein [Turicibacter sp.]
MKIVHLPLLKEQLKRFWVAAIPAIIVVLIAVIGIYVNSQPAEFPVFGEYFRARNLVELLAGRHMLPTTLMLLPLVTVMAFFPHYFSNVAATAIYSLPITKKQLFCTNLAASLVMLFVPLVLICLILLVPVPFREVYHVSDNWQHTLHLPSRLFPNGLADGATINSIPQIIGFFARTAIGILFYLSLFLAAAAVSGNRIMAIVLSGGLPFAPTGLYFLWNLLRQTFVFGADRFSPGAIMDVLNATNPILWGNIIAQADFISVGNVILDNPQNFLQNWQYFLIYSAITAVLMWVAYTSSLRRKFEHNSEVVFPILQHVLIFLICLAGAFLGGLMLGFFFRSLLGLAIGAIVGFALPYILLKLIDERLHSRTRKMRYLGYYGAVCLGCLALTVLAITVGFSGFVNRVPEMAEIQGISIHSPFMSAGVVEDTETIASARALHEEILANRSQISNFQLESFFGIPHFATSFALNYILHDGSVLTRFYTIPLETALWQSLRTVQQNPTILRAQFWAFDNVHFVDFITIFINPPQETDLNQIFTTRPEPRRIIDRAEVEELLPLILADFLEISAENRLVELANNDPFEEFYQDGSITFSLDLTREYWENFNIATWEFNMPLLDFGRANRVREWLEQS